MNVNIPQNATSTVSAAQQQQQQQAAAAAIVYQRGLATIAFITLLFASNSPALHAAFSKVEQQHHAPPVLLLNAACSVVALVAMLVVGPWLDRTVLETTTPTTPATTSTTTTTTTILDTQPPQPPDSSAVLADSNTLSFHWHNHPLVRMLIGDNKEPIRTQDLTALQAGMELGTWKMLGTLLNIVGLSLTSAGHGAFLIQLTTLFVPLAQGVLGVPIPQRIWTAIALALVGVFLFTLDDGGGSGNGASSSLLGDAACVGTAVLYAAYDLRLFHWGQQVEPLRLITTKIVTQTALSVTILGAFAAAPAWQYVHDAWISINNNNNNSAHDVVLVGAVTLWCGLAVNALAPYLQVRGQQAVGPARAQIMYASQPLWAALLSFLVLGETVGTTGLLGGGAFLVAMMLAATAELPDPDCGENICEV